jgi:hypothetical protein
MVQYPMTLYNSPLLYIQMLVLRLARHGSEAGEKGRAGERGIGGSLEAVKGDLDVGVDVVYQGFCEG